MPYQDAAGPVGAVFCCAPCSTGGLQPTHSDTCIQLTQLPRWEERRRTARWKSQRNCMLNIVQSGCKMINRWLSKTVWLEKVSESAQVKAAFSSCNAEGKWFVGSIMNHHGNKKGDWTACAKVVAGTHQSVLWCFPSRCPALLDQVSSEMPGPPACEKWWWKTLCPGVDTHRSPHPALFQKPVAGVVVVSFLDIEPHELSRSSFSAGGWKGVVANGVES